MKRCFRILVAGLILPLSLVAEERPNVPPEIAGLIAKLRDTGDEPPNAAAVLTVLAGLRDSVREVDVRKAKVLEGASIEAKMIVVADAISTRGKAFAEIKDFYITNGIGNARGDYPIKVHEIKPTPLLRKQHANEDFRLAWEFYVLQRRVDGALEFFEERVLEALGTIGDERSAIAVSEQVKINATSARYDPTARAMALTGLPGLETFKVIVECSEIWEQKAKERAMNEAEWERKETGSVRPEFDESIVGAFRKLDVPGKKKWRRVLDGVDVRNLRETQLKLVREVKRAVGSE